MMANTFRKPVGFALLVVLVLGLSGVQRAGAESLPRFTEEREAAALFFVRKHLPELLPLLDQLRKKNLSLYEQEIREIFQVTEFLADLKDDPRRYDLELRIWKTENRAHAIAAHLSAPGDEERKRCEQMLRDLARELVNLDVQVLELKAEQLDKELGEVKDELARARDNSEKQVKERYERLVDKVKQDKK